MHSHPCDLPEKIMKQPPMREEVKAMDVEMKCINWGCDKEFFGDRNTKKEC
jgi:hypothetical protein